MKLLATEYDIGLERFGAQEPVLLLQWVFCDPENFKEEAYFNTVNDIAMTPDPATRTELVYKAEMLMAEEVLIVPLYSMYNLTAVAANVEGLIWLDNGGMLFNDITLK